MSPISPASCGSLLPSSSPSHGEPRSRRPIAAAALADPAIFAADGTLAPAAIAWIHQAGLTPARMAFGPCATVSCGILAYLATAEKAVAQPFFDRVIGHGLRTGWASSSVLHEFVMLMAGGVDVRADLYLAAPIKAVAANARLLQAFPDVVTAHEFDRAALQAQVWGLRPGEAAALFIDDVHAIALVRDQREWHLFDTGLNPGLNTYSGAQDDLPFAPGAATPDGRNYLQGAPAQALIARYLARIDNQPVLLRRATA